MTLKGGLLPLIVLPLAHMQRRYGQEQDCADTSCHFALVTCWDGSEPPPLPGNCCPDLSLCKPDCRLVKCAAGECPDGSIAPVPEDGCCPDPSLCQPDCKNVRCVPAKCPDGSIAPVPKDGCCPDPSLCKPNCYVNKCKRKCRRKCKKKYIKNCKKHCQEKCQKKFKPNCSFVSCMLSKCPDGSIAPIPGNGCCPDPSLCCVADCSCVNCLVPCPLEPPRCSDGSVAPSGDGCCDCPDQNLCKVKQYLAKTESDNKYHKY